MSKTIITPISLPKELAVALDRASKRTAMTRSEFVRDLLRRRLAIESLGIFQRTFAKRARAKGIRTNRDAVRLVRRSRKGK